MIDVTDLENPTFHGAHDHGTTAITHNNDVVDGLVYQSNYTAGLRVLDTASVGEQDPRLEELAFFDTFPRHDEPVFSGTWSNYPFFESGTIAVSGSRSRCGRAPTPHRLMHPGVRAPRGRCVVGVSSVPGP